MQGVVAQVQILVLLQELEEMVAVVTAVLLHGQHWLTEEQLQLTRVVAAADVRK
jgi:hypothetical protein